MTYAATRLRVLQARSITVGSYQDCLCRLEEVFPILGVVAERAVRGVVRGVVGKVLALTVDAKKLTQSGTYLCKKIEKSFAKFQKLFVKL